MKNHFQRVNISVNRESWQSVLTGTKKKILFIGGSLNQTSMLHRISKYLPEYDNYFTPYYTDGKELIALKLGLLENTVLGGKLGKMTVEYLEDNRLQVDFGGSRNNYDLVVTSSDLIIQRNIRDKKIILVQEGMTDPQNWLYYVVKYLKLPRYFASTSTNGLSDAYIKFCVASEGYKEFFIKSGCNPDKIEVTGIPNFDNCKEYCNNNFPYKDYVLVCTSDARETLRIENRIKFIRDAVKIANGRQMIFKLHPNENHIRATREINKYAPGALVYESGNAEEMVANCSVLITIYSSLVYKGLALGKEVYSKFNLDELKKLTPIQNDGQSAKNIADVCRRYLEEVKVFNELNN